MSITVTATGATSSYSRLLSKGKFIGGKKFVIADVRFSGTYATGGFNIAGSQGLTAGFFGLTSVEDINFLDQVTDQGFVPYLVRKAGATDHAIKLYRAVSANGMKTDTFPSVLASTNAADDVAGTTDYSTVATVLGANYGWIVATGADTAATPRTIAHQPDVPRNITVCVHNINGGTVNCAAGTFTIVGTFNGSTVSEVLTFAAVSHANGKMSLKSTSQVFDSITSITPSASSVSGYQTICGIGSRLGLSAPLANAAYTDVVLISQDGANVAITEVTDQTTGTVTATAGKESVLFATQVAAKDNIVKYMAKGTAELAAATNVGINHIRVMAIGV